ncbi:Mor transcription activator family protein [Solimonas flava]|uniref:Mor transcription activator family protein n=1 Tax=Solimonas flava TaxID=415849 RepID=UPI000424FFBC|nr:Mor transcription activator family protein [Solimonas flava]
MKHTPATVDLAPLPPMLRRLVRALGLPATLQLLEARGGTRFYLGGERGRRDRHVLADIIGKEAAEAFYREFGGVPEVTLPKADKIVQQTRDAQIRADTEHSLMELAVMYRLTSRQVQNIRRGHDAREWQDRQPDLFGAA